MKITLRLAPLLALAVVCGLGCKTAKVTSEHELSSPAAKPRMVYITDFQIGVSGIKSDPGFLSGRQGPIGRVGDRLSGASADPAAREREIVDLMANSLVKQLGKSGVAATRLPPGTPLPTEGWLLRGVFLAIDEGNRLRRSMIGLGQGQTDIQVVSTIDDLARGAPKPLYEVATDASSGSQVGAAPTLAFGPYGAAARFVMSGEDLDKNVKQTAAQIAEQVAKRVQQAN